MWPCLYCSDFPILHGLRRRRAWPAPLPWSSGTQPTGAAPPSSSQTRLGSMEGPPGAAPPPTRRSCFLAGHRALHLRRLQAPREAARATGSGCGVWEGLQLRDMKTSSGPTRTAPCRWHRGAARQRAPGRPGLLRGHRTQSAPPVRPRCGRAPDSASSRHKMISKRLRFSFLFETILSTPSLDLV